MQRHNKGGLGIATYGVGQQLSQNTVTIWNVSKIPGERANNAPQRGQRFVNVDRFLEM